MINRMKKYLVSCLALAMVASIFPAADTEVFATEISGNDISDTGESAHTLNYVYLESQFIATPNPGHVVISYGDETTKLADARLTVRNYNTGSEKEYALSDTFENTAVFQLEYLSSDRGIYEVTDLTVVTDDGYRETIHLTDTGMDAVYFGVDEEFEEKTKEEMLSGETMLSAENDEAFDMSQIQMQIVTLGADAKQVTKSDINHLSQVIKEAATEMSGSDISLCAEGDQELFTEAKEWVVMLDPGHDATHAGAYKNGLREEALTLKIAKYCKEELEQYRHVKVYMTRESAACPLPGSSSVTDNRNRVDTAARLGADIYVSIHLNSAGTSSAHGAQVFYPNSNYRPDIGSAGANLATQIQRQIVALGLKNNGISIRNSGDGSKYPDGSLADYYAVIKHSKNSGFPGVIVEHAYVSNASDAAFLKNEANLKALGIADATGIANYLGLSKTSNIDRNKVLAFVTRLYSICLNRAPESEGLKYWTDVICNEEQSGAEVAQGFFFCQEMNNRNLSDKEFLEVLYRVMMDRPSDAEGAGYWMAYMNGGIEREAIFKQFVDSPEYANICQSYGIDRGEVKVAGRNKNPGLTLFMMRLYTKVMGRDYDKDGMDYWCDEILKGNYTIMEVAGSQFFHSKEFQLKNLNNTEYLKVLYRTFFDREYDKEGLNYWLNQMKNGMSRDEVLDNFNRSKEFEQIRANYGILGM